MVLKGMDDSVDLLEERYVRLSTFQEIDPVDIKSISLQNRRQIQEIATKKTLHLCQPTKNTCNWSCQKKKS